MKISSRSKGIACIMISAFFFALMSTFVRLSGDIPSMQKAFFRNIIAVFAAFILLRREKLPIIPPKNRLGILILRSVLGTAGVIFNYYAIDRLVLSDATMLNKMSPFFVTLFSMLFLKEKPKWYQLALIFAAFGGAMLVIKPTFSNADLPAALVGFIGGICAGGAYTCVRSLGTKGVKSGYIVFFFSTFSCLVTLPYVIFSYTPMSFYQLAMLLLAGACATAAQYSITAAYSFAPAKEISVYDYSQIIYTAVIGIVFFGQLPDMFSTLGYAVIILAALVLFVLNNRKNTEKLRRR